jgi:hypothetical protein
MFLSAMQLSLRANRRRPTVRRSIALLAMVMFWCIGLVSARADPTVVDRARLAPGVHYRRIDDPAIPIHTFLLIFKPGYTATLDGAAPDPTERDRQGHGCRGADQELERTQPRERSGGGLHPERRRRREARDGSVLRAPHAADEDAVERR